MLIDNGLKPAWVFDGKPPQFKGGEVKTRHFTNYFMKNYLK